jgi:hypothetical protein
MGIRSGTSTPHKSSWHGAWLIKHRKTLQNYKVYFGLYPSSGIYKVVWRIRAMQDTPSPASGEVRGAAAATVKGRSILHPPTPAVM